MSGYVVSGTVAPGYEGTRKIFEDNFQEGIEEHSQLCVYVKGERVVDLWGTIDKNSGYDGDSLTNCFSNTKSLTAIMMAMAVDRGLLCYDDKIAKHWPEFGQAGKEDITIADLMRHECGLPVLNPPIQLEDIQTENIKQNAMGVRLEKHRPSWPDQGRREYHALTRGWIANEIFRRVDPDGRTLGQFLEAEIAMDLKAEVNIGCTKANYFPIHEISYARCALQAVRKSFGLRSWSELKFSEISEMRRAMVSLSSEPTIAGMKDMSLFNDIKMRRSETPSANGNCSARGLARVGAAMANKGELEGRRLMSEKTWHAMHDKPTRGMLFPFMPAVQVLFTQGGIQECEDDRTGWYGWLGYGGSVFQWNPSLKIGFGYTCTLLYALSLSNQKALRMQMKVAECARKL